MLNLLCLKTVEHGDIFINSEMEYFIFVYLGPNNIVHICHYIFFHSYHLDYQNSVLWERDVGDYIYPIGYVTSHGCTTCLYIYFLASKVFFIPQVRYSMMG